MEGWKIGRMEDWKNGRLEGWESALKLISVDMMVYFDYIKSML